MSPEWQVAAYIVAIVLTLVAAWRINTGQRPAAELGWIGIAVVLLIPLWAAIQAT